MAKPRTCPSPRRRHDPEQIEALEQRMAAMAGEDPRYAALFDTLLQAGGDLIAAQEEPDLDKLLERGYLMPGRGAKRARGRPSGCHENAALLWDMNRDWASIVTGWALSDDGVWRQHSWVKDFVDGRIYETTEPRVLYFGFDLDPRESERFYDGNVLHR
jgi:hypothetical protein